MGSENEGSQVPALVLEKPQCAHLKWDCAPWEQEEGSRKRRGNRSVYCHVGGNGQFACELTPGWVKLC